MIGNLDSRVASLLGIGGFAVIIAIGSAAYAHSANDETAAAIAPVPCEVVATAMGSATNLEAIYNAPGPLNGSYRFSVKTVGGSGSTNINQGGGFSASQAGPVSLGRVTVGPAPSYDIVLSVDVDGKSYDCLNPGEGWA